MSLIENTGYKCWCGTDKWEISFAIPGYRLLHCTNCGVFRNDPPPVSKPEESSDFYTSYYKEKKTYGNAGVTPKTKNSRFWKVAKKEGIAINPDGVVLDLGCGDGDLCNELKQNGWGKVIGTDVSKVRIGNAKTRYPDIDFYDTPIEQTSIEKESIDLIIMDNVIEHIPEPVEFIEAVTPYLKKDGKLVLITPNMESGNFKLLGKKWTPELCPHAHVYLFTVNSINKMGEQASYKVTGSGNFKLKLAGIGTLIKRLFTSGPKAFIWKIMQESGSYYGRVINQGEMLYNVLTKN